MTLSISSSPLKPTSTTMQRPPFLSTSLLCIIFVSLFSISAHLVLAANNVPYSNNLAHSINVNNYNNNNNNINTQLQLLQHTMANMPTNNNEAMYHHQLNSFSNATHELMLELRQGLLTKSTKFDEFFRSLLASSKAEFHRMFIRTYGILYENNAEIFTGMYENLENYYATGGVKLNDAMQSFFNRLYQKMFQVLNMQYDFSPAYLNCTSQQLDKLRPFGAVPDKLITEIKQSFIATRTFVQALNNGIDVIKNLIALGPSAQCNSLVQRVHQLVATSPQVVASRPICVSQCEQIWTKCYSKLNVDLDREWNSYVEALSSLANKMRTSWNIEIVVKPIDIRVSEAIMNFQENGPQITNQVFKACGDPKQAMLGRRKRYANYLDYELRATRKDCDELWTSFSKAPVPNSEIIQQLSADLKEFQRRCSSYPRPRSLARMSERECLRLASLPVKDQFPTRIEEATYQLSKKVYELNCLESRPTISPGAILPRRLPTASIVPTKPDPSPVESSRRIPASNRRNDTAPADTLSPIPARGLLLATASSPVTVAMKSASHKNPTHNYRETTTTLAPISEVQNIEIIGALVSEICDQINRTKGFWSGLPNNVCTNKNVVGNQNLRQLQAPSNCTGFPPSILSDSISSDRYFKGSDRANVNDARYNGVITQQVTTLRIVVSKINKAIDGHEVDWTEPVAPITSTTTTTTTAIPNFPSSETRYQETDSSSTSSDSDSSEDSDNDPDPNDQQPQNDCPPGYEPIPASNLPSDDDVNIETGSGSGPNNDDDEGDETGDGDDEEAESGADEDSDSEDSGTQSQPNRSQPACRPIDYSSSTTSTAKPEDSFVTNNFKDMEETSTTSAGNFIEGPDKSYADPIYSPGRIPRKHSEISIIIGDPESSSGLPHYSPASLLTYSIFWLSICVIRQFAYYQPIRFN